MNLACRPTLPPSALAAVGALLLACSSSSTAPTDAGSDTTPRADAGRDAKTHVSDSGCGPRCADSGHDAGATTDGGDAQAGDAGGPTEAGRPPKPGDGGPPSTAMINFAIHYIWLGDTLPDPAFTPDTTGTEWQKFGYNIDGLLTTQYSTDVCTLDLAAGATSATQVDGPNGLDNSFGENILPTLASTFNNLSQGVSASIAKGDFSVLIDTVGLTSSPTQTSRGLTGQLFEGAPYGSAPALNDAGAFALTDNWPVYSDLLNGPGVDAGSKVSFPSAYVDNGLWVNGSPGDITLNLNISGQSLVLLVHEATITFSHTVDASGQDHATNGIISGVLKTSEFVEEVKVVLADQQLCTEAALVLSLINSASDIMHDGTNASGQVCDGISIGLAFDADAIALPSTVTLSVDAGAAPPCADGG